MTLATSAATAAERAVGFAPPVANHATDEVVVRLRVGVDPTTFAADHGLAVGRPFVSDPRFVVFKAESIAAAESLPGLLAADPRVDLAVANRRAGTTSAGAPFTPNDPYFPRNAPSAGWPGQWHLLNQAVPGRDARVQGAWTAGWTGSGVAIGIVDDSLQHLHPDLAPNYSAALSYDFGGGDGDPSPVHASDNHGTSVAGVAAARGGNGVGVTGAAPLATLAGLRVDFPNQTDAMFADASLYMSSGTNRAIAIKNHSYGISYAYVRGAGDDLQAAAVSTSAAAGTIHLFAAGNDRGFENATYYYDSDANRKFSQSRPDVITVAALSSTGTYASYSNYGANVFVTAPSSSSGGFGITTTDRTGTAGYNSSSGDTFPDRDYTSRFGGTSSATPLVAGVMALVKEAQPDLDVRFAKHLLVRTSDVVDPNDRTVSGGGDGVTAGSAWKTNAAGRTFNMNYGFGLVDAAGLVTEAQAHDGVTTLERYTTGPLAVNAAISDTTTIVRSTTVTLASPRPLEEVVVSIDADHAWLSDMTLTLTSPAGTVSRLVRSNYYGYAPTSSLDWSFTTNAFWGESPSGTWTLGLRDDFAGDTGTWNSWGLTLRMGELFTGTAPAAAALGWTGGSGTWAPAGGGGWSGGEWIDGRTAVFSGSAGTVTVAAGGVSASQGMRFDVGGYLLTGGTIGLGDAGTAATIAATTGTTRIAAPLAGAAGLTKSGSGAVVLTGSNGYRGPTTVAAGTLRIDGWTDADSTMLVLAGATLAGSGTVGGDATVSGAHAPGSSPGVHTFGGDLTYLTGATVEWELWADTESGAGLAFDRIVVGGDLLFSGTTLLDLTFTGTGSTVDWTDPFWTADRAWTIYDVAGSTTGFPMLQLLGEDWLDAAARPFSTVRAGGSFQLATAQAGADVMLRYIAPVPEPTALVLAALGLTAVFGWRGSPAGRRRRLPPGAAGPAARLFSACRGEPPAPPATSPVRGPGGAWRSPVGSRPACRVIRNACFSIASSRCDARRTARRDGDHRPPDRGAAPGGSADP